MTTDKVSLSLTEAEWQIVVNALAARPYAEVHQIISSLQMQFQLATMPPVETPAMPNNETPAPPSDSDNQLSPAGDGAGV